MLKMKCLCFYDAYDVNLWKKKPAYGLLNRILSFSEKRIDIAVD